MFGCICAENSFSITFISIGMQVIFAYLYGLRCSNGDINNQNQYRSTQWVAMAVCAMERTTALVW